MKNFVIYLTIFVIFAGTTYQNKSINLIYDEWILVDSYVTYIKVIKKYGLKETQLVFAPHAIDNERFAEDREKESNTVSVRQRGKIDLGVMSIEEFLAIEK